MPATLLLVYLPNAPLTFLLRSNATNSNLPVQNVLPPDVNVMATFWLRLGEPGTRLPSSAPIDRQSLRKVCLYFPSRLLRASCERWSTFA
jgi:hypothetical protein